MHILMTIVNLMDYKKIVISYYKCIKIKLKKMGKSSTTKNFPILSYDILNNLQIPLQCQMKNG